jgi:hypothetical protein
MNKHFTDIFSRLFDVYLFMCNCSYEHTVTLAFFCRRKSDLERLLKMIQTMGGSVRGDVGVKVSVLFTFQLINGETYLIYVF